MVDETRPLGLFLDFKAQACLVVGAGTVASRKIRSLIGTGADITVVAPEASPEISELCLSHGIAYHAREFSEQDLVGKRLAIAATGDLALNAAIAEAAKKLGVWVNVADPGMLGDAFIPKVIDRKPLQIALFSAGTSPALVRQLHRQLEAFIPKAYGRLAEFAGSLRERVKQAMPDEHQRCSFWRGFPASPAAGQLLAGNDHEALRLAEAQISGRDEIKGPVTLVGAGPGDPELLTLKALRLLQQADVVVHDRLVGPGVMALIPDFVELIDVGKAPGSHKHDQGSINRILIEQASLGKRVVRLKGGDSFVFGRGGEEIEALTAAGIACQVVPGITAAIGSASIASIPLTHRQWSHGCIFLPGQFSESTTEKDWRVFAQFKQTLVFYMSVGNIEKICTCLLDNGMAAEMPVALVQQATLPQQKISIATLGEWSKPCDIKKEPGILIVGETVRLSPWFPSSSLGTRNPAPLPEGEGET